MTDTILVDQDGHFKIGKSATTPKNEAEGFLASAEDAADAWGISLEDLVLGRQRRALFGHRHAQHAVVAHRPQARPDHHQGPGGHDPDGPRAAGLGRLFLCRPAACGDPSSSRSAGAAPPHPRRYRAHRPVRRHHPAALRARGGRRREDADRRQGRGDLHHDDLLARQSGA